MRFFSYIKQILLSPLLIVSLGLLFRIILVVQLPLWLDERTTASIIRHGYWPILNGSADAMHPPGYYLFLKTLSIISANYIFLRFSSVLFFLINSWFFYRLGKHAEGRTFAQHVLFFYVFSGYFIIFDWQIRMYTLLSCFILFSLYLSVQKNDFFRLGASALINAVGLFVDYGFAFYLLPLILWRFLCVIKTKRRTDLENFFASLVGPLLFAAIWLPSFMHYVHAGLKGIEWIRDFDISYFFGPIFFGTYDQFIATCLMATMFLNGLYFVLFRLKNMFLWQIVFIATVSLAVTKIVSVTLFPILHIRSLQIVAIALVFVYGAAVERYSIRSRYLPLFLFLFVLGNFLLVAYSIPNKPGTYVLTFGDR